MSTQDKKPTNTTNTNNTTAKSDQSKKPAANAKQHATENAPGEKKSGKVAVPDTTRTTMSADKNQSGRKDSK